VTAGVLEIPAKQGRGFVIPRLSQEALALLGFLHRAAHGGPQPPQGFEKGYNELLALKLAIRDAGLVKITDLGEAALRERYLRD
jgi:hypothetical protein